MYRKTASLLAAFVAFGGFALAACIPGASAQKPKGTYSEYCEYTEYIEYNEYCEPQTTTTVTNGTTTVITSSGFIVKTPAAAATAVTGTASVAVAATGSAVVDVAALKPGQVFTANGVAVKVLGFSKDGVVVSFGGVSVDVPSTAAVAISADGTVTVTYFVANGQLIPALKLARAAAFHPIAATGEQDIILPSGKSSDKFSYLLTKGVSFGVKATRVQIAKDFTIESTGTSALRVGAKTAKLASVAHTVAPNRARTAVTVKLAKPERSYIIKFNVSQLQYSAAEQAAILANHVTTLNPKFLVKAQAGKTIHSDRFSFIYPV